MHKKILVIILFIITFIFINFKFKITNYVTLNILNKNNIFNSVIDDSTLEKIIDKKEFLYKNKKYKFDIVKIDKNILNNQVISTIDIKTNIEYKENYIYKVNIKTNIEYKENYIYKVNIKINEITVLDYIFNYVRGKK